MGCMGTPSSYSTLQLITKFSLGTFQAPIIDPKELLYRDFFLMGLTVSLNPFRSFSNHLFIVINVALRKNSDTSMIDRNQNHWNQKCDQKNTTSHVE